MANPLSGDVEIPAVGSVPKKVLVPVAVGAVAFVGWRFWLARNGVGNGDEPATISDGEFGAVDSAVPGVLGAVKDGNAYGSGDTTPTGDQAGAPTTNAAWSQLAIAQLNQGDKWSYADITSALGNYLGAQPLSTEQQTIVRAAIAVAGYPPVGTHSIVPGGNTPLTVAPTNVHLQEARATQLIVAFNPVPGATGYRVYLDGIGANVGSSAGSPITVSGLQPNTTHTVAVKGFTATSDGPKSASITAKTLAVALAKPATPTVSSITARTAKVSTGRVANADGYRWYIDGNARGYSEAPTYTITGLTPNKRYTVTVAADRTNQNPGAHSAARAFTTKRK